MVVWRREALRVPVQERRHVEAIHACMHAGGRDEREQTDHDGVVGIVFAFLRLHLARGHSVCLM